MSTCYNEQIFVNEITRCKQCIPSFCTCGRQILAVLYHTILYMMFMTFVFFRELRPRVANLPTAIIITVTTGKISAMNLSPSTYLISHRTYKMKLQGPRYHQSASEYFTSQASSVRSKNISNLKFSGNRGKWYKLSMVKSSGVPLMRATILLLLVLSDRQLVLSSLAEVSVQGSCHR